MRDFSNYHEINYNTKVLHDGELIFERALEGFEAYDAILNDDRQIRILLNNKFSSIKELRTVIGKPSDVERGNVYTINSNYWLVTTFPEDNRIYRKADARLCNATFTLKTDPRADFLRDENGELILDRFGNPIPIEIEGTVKNVPCVYESKILTVNENNQLPLPDGRIHITMAYQKADNLKLNEKFVLKGIKYKISDFDYSGVVNEVGIMTIIADRVVDN